MGIRSTVFEIRVIIACLGFGGGSSSLLVNYRGMSSAIRSRMTN